MKKTADVLLSAYRELIAPLPHPDTVEALQTNKPVRGKINGHENFLAVLVRLPPVDRMLDHIKLVIVPTTSPHHGPWEDAVYVWDEYILQGGSAALGFSRSNRPKHNLEVFLDQHHDRILKAHNSRGKLEPVHNC